jgi:hypothetical protein
MKFTNRLFGFFILSPRSRQHRLESTCCRAIESLVHIEHPKDQKLSKIWPLKHFFTVISAAFLMHVWPAAAQPVPVTEKRAGHCSALTPAGWTAETTPSGDAFDTFSPDGRSYAGKGVVGIDPSMRQFYGPMYGAPEESILAFANIIGQRIGITGINYASPGESHDDYYTVRKLSGVNGQGVVLFRIYPNMPMPGRYIESMYFALAPNSAGPRDLSAAIGTMLSIRCEVHLMPQERSSPSRRTNAKGKQVCEKRSPLNGYNRWLGVQEFHDSSGKTHRIYNDISETTGNEGKGHYVNKGGSPERLQEGRADDC